MKRTASLSLLSLAPFLLAFLPAPVVEPAPQKTFSTGYVAPTPERRAYFQALSRKRHGDRIKLAAANLSAPAKFDVRDKVPLPMGDQAQCGSCYLYSTIWFTFTSAGVQAGYGKPDGSYRLSCQWAMDRPRDFGGCNGGWGAEVAEYICHYGMPAEKWVDAGGVVHKDYPAYEARSASDRTAPGAKVWCKGWTWGFVADGRTPTTAEVKAALMLHGRLNVAVDAGGQFSSGTGTITALGRSINHEINLVAWDDSKDGGSFLLENQWGTYWGVNGYRWVTYTAAQNLTDHFWVSAGVVPPPPPDEKVPVVTGGSVGAQVGKPFSYQIVATGSPTSYAASTSIPPGLTVTPATGLIAGTPAKTGKYDFNVYATNSGGTGSAALTITVGDAPPAPDARTVTSITITYSDGTTQVFYDLSQLKIVPR